MHTDLASAIPMALFLFAHQDDEFGVFHEIIDVQRKGYRVICAYITTGVISGVSPQRRNRESLLILKQLRVQEQDIFFTGCALSIPDTRLHEHLEPAANWIRQLIGGFSSPLLFYVPAWEGGHHDHDALHAITVSIAQERNMLGCVRQFSLYNAYRCAGALFRVFAPLPHNGPIEVKRISWKHRLHFLRYCLSYPSQAMTWIGLFPFVFLHYMFNGKQMLQPVSYERISKRPHNGPLYYEKRGFFTWEKMAACLIDWRKCYIGYKPIVKRGNKTFEQR
jgi:LmbE family N-acetylglucosaminyl deacetylase